MRKGQRRGAVRSSAAFKFITSVVWRLVAAARPDRAPDPLLHFIDDAMQISKLITFLHYTSHIRINFFQKSKKKKKIGANFKTLDVFIYY